MVALVEHAFDISDDVDSVLADVVQPSDKWRDINGCPRAFGRRVNRGRLLLRKAERDVDPYAFGDRTLCRLQSFSGARVFYVGIRNPRTHLPALLQHFVSGRVEISKHLD